MSDRNHNIEVKSLFRPANFIAFRNACNEADVPVSRKLRNLADWWVEWKNLNKGSVSMELPEPAQVMAMFSAFRGGTPFPQLV